MYFISSGLLVVAWAYFLVVCDSLCVSNGELMGGNLLVALRAESIVLLCFC